MYSEFISGDVDEIRRARRRESTKAVARGTRVRRIPNTAQKMESPESPMWNCQKAKIQMGKKPIRH